MKRKAPKRLKKRRKALSDLCLIVHGTRLLHTKHHNLIAQPDESLLNLTPKELADAAKRLLPRTTSKQRIALALPSSEFVATTLTLPPNLKEDINQVVKLQLPTLLPGITEPLLLAVQKPVGEEQTCALWMPAKRADELFHAFEQVGLFLSCILPRPVLLLPNTLTPYQIYDEDEGTMTCLEWSGHVIEHWLHTSKVECDLPEFQEQFEQAQSNFNEDLVLEKRITVSDWEEMSMPSLTAYDYAFIPPSTTARMEKAAKRKRQLNWTFLALLFIAGIMGGIYFALDYERQLKQQLADLKHRTDSVSQLRAQVNEIEALIGPVKHFPRQEVVTILETLDQMVPKDSWITNFYIEGGAVKLEGLSPNPTEIVELLWNNPHVSDPQTDGITNVNNRKEDKFRIKFKLKDFDLGSYWMEYFPEK
jgi:Tfp pilus assembly protein PilN